MPEHQPRKSTLSPSPLPLALLIAISTILVVGGVYLFVIGMTTPVPSQTGAYQSALASATSTAEVEVEQEPNYELTPTRELPVPTNAPLPLGFETIPLPPPPTEINYTPGPTASLDEVPPLGEWKEYVNEQQGFTIKYPPNWYLNAGPTGQTTQIFSYDFNDPAIKGYKGPPLNVTGIDIYARRGQLSVNDQLKGNETIREWVYRTGRVGEDDEVIGEEEIIVDGFPALRQLVDYDYGGLMEAVYIRRPTDVILVGQPYREDWTVPNQVFDLLIQNLRIEQ